MTRTRLPLCPTGALAAALSCIFAAPAAAQVPDLMPYQGYLTDDAGAPYDGDVSLTFRMYQSGDSPGPMWTEVWDDVPVEDGVFYVYLGMFSPVADAIASGNARYLGVAIDGEGEASPRQRVGSVPYAMMARDAQSLGGYTADDFVSRADLGNYARWDALGERGYATEQWVRDQSYLTEEDIADINIDLEGYATEQWVRDQGYASEQWVRDQGYLGAGALDGYASEEWVREQGYVGAAALDDYASEDWVAQYVADQGHLTADALDGYATEDWVGQYVSEQGYLTAGALEGYASEQWVRDQGYLGAAALDGYASEQWVRDQGYLGAAALDGYASEQWVRDQGYLTGAALDARGYATGDDLDGLGAAIAADYVSNAALDARGYATEQWVRDQGYLTGAELDARDYATTAYVDQLRADVSQTYVTRNALDNRGYIDAAALDARGYATAAALAALSDQVAALQAQLQQVAAAGAAYLLGVSAQSSNGRFSFGGQTGIRAANAMCRASFANEPTAHFCSPDEVFRAVSTGSYDAAQAGAIDNTFTWTITQTAITARGNNSLAGNCQNLLYNSADASSGARLRVDFGYQSNGNGGGVTGDVVQINQEINCGTSLPVLCCR